jgi:hypothetical protein
MYNNKEKYMSEENSLASEREAHIKDKAGWAMTVIGRIIGS